MRVPFVLLLTAMLACAPGAPSAAVAFQIYDGNESLPPQYQNVLIIRGRFERDRARIDYSRRHGEQTRTRSFTVTGELLDELHEVAQETRFRESDPVPAAGAPSFDVTLTDATGKNVMGKPQNEEAWRSVAAELERLALESAD